MQTAAGFGKIPVNDLDRHIGPMRDALARVASRVIDSGWFVLGPCVREFEAAFAAYCGVDHCIGVGNGTDALELALRACGAGPGSRVITVANAGGYSTTAILSTGAEPAYVDVRRDDMLLDHDALLPAITPNTSAIVVTHLYGRMVDMPAVMEIAGRQGIPVVEDCAQAHGACLHDRRAGSWGSAGCFSFYPTKNLGALGDGGAVVTSDSTLAAAIRRLRQYGWAEKYHSGLAGGRNTRLDEMQAAFLLEQLPMLDSWNERRREIASLYSHSLDGLDIPGPGGDEYVAHLYVMRTGNRDFIRQQLAHLGIGTDVHYPVPDHWQQAWREYPWANVRLAVTESLCEKVLTLPCFPELSNDEVRAVAGALRGLLSAG